jgi:flagellar hook-length control protein FliK
MKINKLLLSTSCFFAILSGVLSYRLSQTGIASAPVAGPTTPARASSFARTEMDRTDAPMGSSKKSSAARVSDAKAKSALIQIPPETAKRLLSNMRQSAIDGTPPGKLTWSKDCLALLGVDEAGQQRMQKALDQVSARSLAVMKTKVKTVSETADTQTYQIPDWSKEEGAALRAELAQALDREMNADNAALLLGQLPSGASQALFGEGDRLISFISNENGSWQIEEKIANTKHSTNSHSNRREFPKEWLEIFKLSGPPGR